MRNQQKRKKREEEEDEEEDDDDGDDDDEGKNVMPAFNSDQLSSPLVEKYEGRAHKRMERGREQEKKMYTVVIVSRQKLISSVTL